MRKLAGWAIKLVIVLVCLLAGWFTVKNYSFIFSRKVVGTVTGLERIPVNMAIMQSGQGSLVPNQMFSFAIAIKEKSGEILTASSEDRQWAVVEKGQCVEARYYPYPPWNFEKGGTYANARLEKLQDCTSQK
jgi:hypothetical protein